MNKEEQKLLLNQVRHRILQYVLHHGEVTVKEIREELSDIPQASLYRQIKILAESGMIRVSEEKQIRGTLEHTYVLSPELVDSDDKSRTALNIQFTLLSLAQDINDYHQQNEKEKDMVGLISSPLLMNDDEYRNYMDKINELTRQYINNKPGEGRKSRRMTFIASPAY